MVSEMCDAICLCSLHVFAVRVVHMEIRQTCKDFQWPAPGVGPARAQGGGVVLADSLGDLALRWPSLAWPSQSDVDNNLIWKPEFGQAPHDLVSIRADPI